jgi:hypothetical protein
MTNAPVSRGAATNLTAETTRRSQGSRGVVATPSAGRPAGGRASGGRVIRWGRATGPSRCDCCRCRIRTGDHVAQVLAGDVLLEVCADCVGAP